MTTELPMLPYDFAALEPGMSADTLGASTLARTLGAAKNSSASSRAPQPWSARRDRQVTG